MYLATERADELNRILDQMTKPRKIYVFTLCIDADIALWLSCPPEACSNKTIPFGTRKKPQKTRKVDARGLRPWKREEIERSQQWTREPKL